MYRMYAFIMITALFCGCRSSLELPSIIESERNIAERKPMIDSLDRVIAGQTASFPKGYDIISRTRLSAVNILLRRLTNDTTNDIHITLRQTRPLWKEEKSVFGISYVNSVDIDTGTIDIDLKNFIFHNISDNIVNAELEIEGTGTVHVSGNYTGMPAKASPQIQFYLHDQLQFALSAADSDYLLLTPLPKTVLLKTKVSTQLLGWKIPFTREIPLQSTDVIKPVRVPSAIRSEIVIPIPASHFGQQQAELVRRNIYFTKTMISAGNNVLEYRGNIDFSK